MSGRPKIVLVVAADQQGVIGRDGNLPWHIPEDLQHFKKITMGKPMLMGRKTFDSIGRPLPGRLNLVLSRDPAWQADGTERVASLDEALERSRGSNELMVIGGEQLFRLAMPHADTIELTEVEGTFEGDTYFPIISSKDWTRTREVPLFSRKQGISLNFVTLQSRERGKESYLDLDLSSLLQKYGEGRHIPGSGSAAALFGLMSARLIATVAKLSYNRISDKQIMKRFRYIDHQINTTHLPELQKLFDEDIKAFDLVWRLRKERDTTTDQRAKKNIKSKERRRLQNATAIPDAISQHCLVLGEYALFAYKHGYKAVRGDSGAAVSAACAGALSATFVMGVNLSRFSKGQWHGMWSRIARQREIEAVAIINKAIAAVEDLRDARTAPIQDELRFDS